MKTIILIFSLISLGYGSFAQNLNNINEENKNAFGLYLGYDSETICELNYYRKLNTKMDSWFLIEYSTPIGENIFNDYSTYYGINIEANSLNDFHVFTSLKTGYKRMLSESEWNYAITSSLGFISGYFRPDWYIAGEFGYIPTAAFHTGHNSAEDEDSDINCREIKGISCFLTDTQVSYSIKAGTNINKNFSLNLEAGLKRALKNHSDALPRYYAQIGLLYKI